MGGCGGQRKGRGKHTRGVAPGPTTEWVPEVEIVSQSPVGLQALKNHLRLIRGSTILGHTGTRILGGRLIRGSDLYASIYGTSLKLAFRLYRVYLPFLLLSIAQTYPSFTSYNHSLLYVSNATVA